MARTKTRGDNAKRGTSNEVKGIKMRYKTNDGTIVDTRKATARYKGKYVRGRVAEILYHDPIGGYYLVNSMDRSVEWYCPELAIAWFQRNGIWDFPANLAGTK